MILRHVSELIYIYYKRRVITLLAEKDYTLKSSVESSPEARAL